MHIKYSLWLCWKVIRLTCFIWFDSSTPSREKRFRWEKSGKPPAFPGSCSRSAIVVGRCCHLKYLPHVHLALHPLSLPWPLTSDRWKADAKGWLRWGSHRGSFNWPNCHWTDTWGINWDLLPGRVSCVSVFIQLQPLLLLPMAGN